MKKYLYTLVTLSLLGSVSCKKEITSTCRYSIFYAPFGFAFEGFTLEEVDTLILKTYEPGTEFSTLLHTDTIYTIHHVLKDSILYRDEVADAGNMDSGSGFGPLAIGSEYILEIPALQSTIKVKELTQGPTSHTFQVIGHCSPGAGTARFASYGAQFESIYQTARIKGLSMRPNDVPVLVKK
ncbi:MAG: hypothetical protein BGO31_09940 [Bacteroidetes bacterium 43-16]|nr:MAG: hypothetical protein BGO31_09940 [Bacteroidetes bacterium 43-16]